MRESFIFYASFGALIELLPSKKRLQIYEAIYHYGAYQKETDFSADAQLNAVWSSILPQLKANQKRYENGKKGAESGVLGGNNGKGKYEKNREKEMSETPPKGVEENTPTGVEKSLKNTPPKSPPNVNDNVNPYQDLLNENGKWGNVTRTREAIPLERFLEKWGVNSTAIGNYSGGQLSAIDWDKLSARVEKSKGILQKRKDIGFFIKHYADILDGAYDDWEKEEPPKRVKKSGYDEFDGSSLADIQYD